MSNTFLRWAWLSLLLASTPARAQGPAAASPTKEAPVTLHQALKLAEKSAPTIHVARAEAKAGRAEVDAASPLLPSDPVLFGSVGRRTTAAGSGIDYSIGLEQEIDVAGKRSKRLDAARSDLAARRAELSASKWSVHQRVHAAYHRAIVARERLAAAGRVLRFSERVVDVARQRLSAGETSPLPVRLAETQLAEARQERMRSQSAYNRVRLELGRWVGWTGAGLLTPTGRLHAPRVPPPAETLLRRARHEQPALVAARARSAAAHAGLRSAERSAWPNPTLGVVVESEAEPGAEAAHIVRGTLSLPLPLWVGGTPERARARARVIRARAEHGALTSDLRARVLEAREHAHTGARRARVYGSEILPTLEKNLELLRKSFELGEIDVLDVLVAQERFLRGQQDALAAFQDYYDAWARLEAIVGVELGDP